MASTLVTRILGVGSLTLVSRVFGFIRDVIMAAVLGAGPIADAFLVAFRLPNHFRAIVAEGAFSAAFVPAYARIAQQQGSDAAIRFADRVFTLLFVSVAGVVLAAVLHTPGVIQLLAPGFVDDPDRYPLAIDFTRITFPYLLLMSLVTLLAGVVNAEQRFAAAAAAPILLNLTLIAALSLAHFFPTAGHAAAWGVLGAGFLQVSLLAWDASRGPRMVRFARPRLDEQVRRFFRALGPAVVGSAGLQLAMLADTVIASFLAAGAISALYYADRLNQLPIGVIGIAAGTVLLPEMSRRLAAGDPGGAAHAQNRAIELTLLLAVPCVVAFLCIPDLIMRALFMRGAFTADAARAAAMTLAAYATGLLPFVLLRCFTAPFHARGDTTTPVKAALTAVAVNIALKLVLMGPLAQAGLALATAIGAWINVGLLVWFARRRGFFGLDAGLKRAGWRIGLAGLALAALLQFGADPLARAMQALPTLRNETTLVLLVGAGGVVYLGLLAALFGPARIRSIVTALRRKGPPAAADPPASV